MKLVDMTCPHCGAPLKADLVAKECRCEYCGARIPIDDQTIHLKYDDAEESGYQFEKGRQRAQEEAMRRQRQNTPPPQYQYNQISPSPYQNRQEPSPYYQAPPKKKRKTWLWIMGWLFIFPAPLTVLLSRKKNMNSILKYTLIAVSWILFFVMVF